MGEPFRPVAPVDPTNMRPMLGRRRPGARLQRMAHLLPHRRAGRARRAVLPGPGGPARRHRVGYRGRPPAAAAAGADGAGGAGYAVRRPDAPGRRRDLAAAGLPVDSGRPVVPIPVWRPLTW